MPHVFRFRSACHYVMAVHLCYLKHFLRGLSYHRHVPFTIAGLPCRWVRPSRVAASLDALRYYFTPDTLFIPICQRTHPFIVHTVSLALECRSLTVSVGANINAYSCEPQCFGLLYIYYGYH